MTCVPEVFNRNSHNMSEVKCISRNPYRRGLDKYLAKPFKDASADLRILLEPLSLFSTEHTLKDSCKDLEKHEKTIVNNVHDEHCLMECVAKQLHLKQSKDNPYLSLEEQQEFITVLLNEVSHIEPAVKEQINNPSLSVTQQKKLNSRLHQSVIQICENLFQHYCDKAKVLHEKGIFSGMANLCRLRTQLLLHAEKILTIQGVKRKLMNMKDAKKDDSPETIEDRLRVIQQMPCFKLDKLLSVSLHPLSRLYKQERSPELPSSTDERETTDTPENYPSPSCEKFMPIRRCRSQPQLSYGETIWDEIEMEAPTWKRRNSLENGIINECLNSSEWELSFDMISKQKDSDNNTLHSISLISQDLTALLRNRRDYPDLHSLLLDDMPPLIKAVPRDEKRKKAREKMDKQIQELYEKEKTFQEKNSFEIPEPLFDQPTILTTQLAAQTTARTTDVRVSKRIKGVSHHLVSMCPQYNDLLGEIDAESVKEFDKPLFEEKDLAGVFQGFLSSIQHHDNAFDDDTTFTDVRIGLNVNVNASLQCKGKGLLNQNLCQFEHPPWHKNNYNQWVLQPQKMFTVNNEEIHPRIPDVKRPSKKETRDLKYWRYWWNSVIKSDDYLKYLSLQDTDFLSTIFHLYDEEEKKGEIRGQSASRSSTKDSKQQQQQGDDEKSLAESRASGELKPFDISKYQGRFNKMWNSLQMTQERRIELAIRFSTYFNHLDFQMKLDDWEKATQLINQRENIMASLMTFESEASDPNRFFVRGPGNARMRLDEAKCRSTLYKRIEQLDKKISKQLTMINTKYGEVVTYQDRPYLEKMKWDRIEMLHWLQEVRKINALHYESKRLQVEMPEICFNDILMELS